MKILVAPDKFKGSLSSFEACKSITQGILEINDQIELLPFPMADGGDGFAAVLKYYLHTQTVTCKSFDPLMRPIDTAYEWDSKTKTAIIELAAASGLQLLNRQDRNPLKTSTYGTGIMIQHAIKTGAQKIVLGLGGSATNDAGMGILAALGFQFLDFYGNALKPAGESLQFIQSIISPPINVKIPIEIACDVENVLYGFNGAAYVYAAQKGAAENDLSVLDQGLQNFAKILQSQTAMDIAFFPGAGAAGGVAAGLVPYFDVTITGGAKLIIEKSSLAAKLKGIDLIITGEGKLDSQSFNGKVISNITRLAALQHIPVIALCGKLAITTQQVKEMGLLAAYSISIKNPYTETDRKAAGALLRKLASKVLAEFLEAT